MKDGFLKIACVTPPLRVADCAYNAEQIIAHAREAAAAGAKLAIIIAPLTRARLPLVVDRCLCISTPGKTVDVVVTQRGIAVNTEGGKNVELKEKLKEAKLPVVEIADLKRMAEEIAGVPKPVQMGDKVVANVIYRDGTLLDVIHSVK